MGTKILSSAYYLPEGKLNNEDFEKFLDTSSDWIIERTGMKSRRISNVNTSVLASRAAKKAIELAGIDANEIDAIIVATCTTYYHTPSVASLVQGEIGIKDKPIACFDVMAACTGFIYIMQVAKGLMLTNQYKKMLIIGAETLTKITDYTDRGTAILFGDGAGAMVLAQSETEKLIDISLSSRTDTEQNLIVPGVPVGNHLYPTDTPQYSRIIMNGSEVFKFAVRAVRDSIKKCLKDNNLTIDDIDYIIPHQANLRIIDHAVKLLKFDKEKFFVNIEKTGNTSAASIAIALGDMNERGLLKRGKKYIAVGFGGGLTYGYSLFEW